MRYQAMPHTVRFQLLLVLFSFPSLFRDFHIVTYL